MSWQRVSSENTVEYFAEVHDINSQLCVANKSLTNWANMWTCRVSFPESVFVFRYEFA